MATTAPFPVNSTHFYHNKSAARYDQPSFVTQFDGKKIQTPDNLLTLVIRADAHFATRSLVQNFTATGNEMSRPTGLRQRAFQLHKEQVEGHYKTWGNAIVAATINALDYSGKYNLDAAAGQQSHVHFHTADSMAGDVIRGACKFADQTYSRDTPVLFVSLDDMINTDVFRKYSTRGQFEEIGFSRVFDRDAKELGFVGRPGKDSIDAQINHIREVVDELHESSGHKVPIILLEDNVRRAKTILWIVDEMERRGVFQNSEMAAVATCFSVAGPDERSKIRFHQKPVPVIVGVDYSDSKVDVFTPRDHLFDGFVVESKGHLGRLPSFMLDHEGAAKNFKIDPKHSGEFMERVIAANIDFCTSMRETTGIAPPLSAFVPGPTIAEVLNISPETPMEAVLRTMGKTPSGRRSYAPAVESARLRIVQ